MVANTDPESETNPTPGTIHENEEAVEGDVRVASTEQKGAISPVDDDGLDTDEDDDDEGEDEDKEDNDDDDTEGDDVESESEEDEEDDDLDIEDYDAMQAVGAFKSVYVFLRPYFDTYRSKILFLCTGVLLESAFNAAFPFCLKYLLDDALYEEDSEALEWILGVLGVLGVVVSVASIYYDYLNAKLGSTILGDIRQRIFDHVQSLSAAFYSKTKVGDVLSRFSTDMVDVEEAVMHAVSWGILPFLELFTGTILLFVLNWKLAMAAILIFPITILGSRYFAKHAVAASYQKKEYEAATMSVVSENVMAQPVVKAFGLRGIALMWFQLRNTNLVSTSSRVHFLSAMVERAVTVSVLMLHLVILGFGAYLVFHKMGLTIGSLVAFESVFWELSYNIAHVSSYVPTLIHAAGSIQHINDLLEEEPQVEDRENAIEAPAFQQGIIFSNVDFSYDGEQRQLKKLNLTIPKGKKIAVVGPSGSGKSTVLNLLLRFYEATSGTVTIDGVNFRDVQRESLLQQMAVVFQENILFNISIRENIRLGNQNATDQEVIAAARAAEIHKFIKSLPAGYDTVVGERGSRLSGGQRQRIAIARAIIRNPAILLLDEATSALDQSTEAAINATLEKISSGRTVVFVTHRLTSVVDADQIVVLDRGKLVESGTHEELLRKRGLYSQLWRKQGGKQKSVTG